MNQRIQELADQVGLGTQHNGIVLTKNVNAAEAFEQFAELIVRECADRCEMSPYPHPNYSVAIKKHFGVES
jgi:wyosine [tRNA(Phe)-imidazoG37] synthetase (radical SAM superfamily)